jgi:chloramphenicol-sensitive protein RarD
LILSGPITTVPLLFFGAAARRLRLSTMGIIQYLTPTLQFLLAVVAFGEPLSLAKLLSFVCIWAAVLIYAFDSLNAARSYPVAVIEPD